MSLATVVDQNKHKLKSCCKEESVIYLKIKLLEGNKKS